MISIKEQTQTRPRVFVVMPTDKDVRRAARYGDITPIFERGEEHPSIFAPEFADEAVQRLADVGYDPKSDYVLLAGPMVAVVSFCSALVCEYECPLALCYDVIQGSYTPRRIGRERKIERALPSDARAAC